jgi:NAD(P)-dependent dehydrogenase (short-subunit alcohol dehydrogenase family)
MNVQSLVIITGASRGLGQAMAARCLADGAFVLGLSRRRCAELAPTSAGGLEQWCADLADPQPLAERLAAWLADFEQRGAGSLPKRVHLIHNAAMLSAPGDVADADAAELVRSLRIGLEAPVALTAAFLRATGHWSDTDRRVLFISSGLGRRAMAGSAAYCAQKAGLDHFARALALEEAARPHGARVASVAPGIIDTDMQKQLRGADPGRFAAQATFAGFHTSGALDSPAAAAAKVIAVLERDDYGREPVTDVRSRS